MTATTAELPAALAHRTFETLQLGLGWLPEQAGGLNRVFYNLVRHLPAAGVGVRGLVAGSDAVSQTSDRAVRAFASEADPLPRRLLAARQAVQRALAAEAFDLVASHFALYTFPARGALSDRPLVVHFHGPWADESSQEGAGAPVVRLKRALERAVYHQADRLIVLSGAFRDVLVQRYGLEASRIRIVPGGVEAERFDSGIGRREARERMGWPTDRAIVLAVRRLRRRMGLEDLVEAAARARGAVPDLLVLIAGAGPLRRELDALIEARGLRRHVRLLGFVPDEELPAAYRAADLTIVPTVALEGFGLIVAESLAAGTPPLVTPVGGLPEVVRGLSEGLILPDTGPDALAEGLVQALSGRLALPNADACRAFARAHYDWSAVAWQTRAVYDEVVA